MPAPNFEVVLAQIKALGPDLGPYEILVPADRRIVTSDIKSTVHTWLIGNWPPGLSVRQYWRAL